MPKRKRSSPIEDEDTRAAAEAAWEKVMSRYGVWALDEAERELNHEERRALERARDALRSGDLFEPPEKFVRRVAEWFEPYVSADIGRETRVRARELRTGKTNRIKIDKLRDVASYFELTDLILPALDPAERVGPLGDEVRIDPAWLRTAVDVLLKRNRSLGWSAACSQVARKFGYKPSAKTDSAKAVKKAAADLKPDRRYRRQK